MNASWRLNKFSFLLGSLLSSAEKSDIFAYLRGQITFNGTFKG